MQHHLALWRQPARREVRVRVADQQDHLKEHHAGRPHRRGAAKPRQDLLRDDRLHQKQQEGAEEDCRTKDHAACLLPAKSRDCRALPVVAYAACPGMHVFALKPLRSAHDNVGPASDPATNSPLMVRAKSVLGDRIPNSEKLAEGRAFAKHGVAQPAILQAYYRSRYAASRERSPRRVLLCAPCPRRRHACRFRVCNRAAPRCPC